MNPISFAGRKSNGLIPLPSNWKQILLNPPTALLRGSLFLICLFYITGFGIAQDSSYDSLKKETLRSLESSAYNETQKYELTIKICTETYINGTNKDYLILLPYIKEALSWAELNRSSEGLIKIRFLYYLYLHFNQDWLKVIEHGNQLLKVKKLLSDKDLYDVYVILCEAYKNLNYFTEYINLIPRKYEALRKLRDNKYQFNEYSDLGSAYYAMKQYDIAIDKYKKAIKETPKDIFTVFKGSMHNNIGIAFKKLKLLDSARYHFEIAIYFVKNSQKDISFKEDYKQHFINVIENNIVALIFSEKQYDAIIIANEKQIKSGLESGESSIYLGAYNTLGKTYYYKRDYKKALYYLDKVLSDKNFIFDKQYLINTLWRAKTLLAQGKVEEANRNFESYENFKDSLELVKVKNKSDVAAILYETDKNEIEIQEQRLALGENEIVINAQKQKQLFFTIFIVFLFVLILVLYFFFKKVKAQKQLLDTTLQQKDLLLKEIHHRVKNNLQVVTSILKIHATRSDNGHFKELMESSQNRIKAMAMIHQRLYQTGDFENTNIEEYVKEMVKSITLSYKQSDIPIDIIVNISNHFLHIDIAVPLGLILNELITNCFKYAFVGRSSGEIVINLDSMDNNKYKLQVIDNGIGLPKNLDKLPEKSFGLTMIKGLAWQLDGTMEYESNEKGSEFTVVFSNAK